MRAVLLVMGLVGCVAKGRHEIVEVQLQATRTALSSRTAQCIVDDASAEAARQALDEEVARRQLQLDELVARAALAETGTAGLVTERLAWLDEVARLEAELAAVRARVPAPKRGAPEVTEAPPPATVASLASEEVRGQLAAHATEDIERQRVEAAQTATLAAFAGLVAEERAEVETRDEAAVVRIPTSLLFQEGFTTLSPRGVEIVAAVSAALATVPGRRVTVEGHTDDTPVHTADFASNWERGFSRAMAVLRGLEESGAVLSAASYAGTRPLGPNDTEAERRRNERVELVIEPDPDLVGAFPPTPPEEPAAEESVAP